METSEIGLLIAVFIVLILVFIGAYFALITVTKKQMTAEEIAEELALSAAIANKKAKAIADAQAAADRAGVSEMERAKMIADIQIKYEMYAAAIEAAKPTVYKVNGVTITTTANADDSYSVLIEGTEKTNVDIPPIGKSVTNAPFMGYTQVITTTQSKIVQNGIRFDVITTQGLSGGKIDVTTIAYDVPAPVYNKLPPP